MVVPHFVQQAIAGEPITVYGDGQQTRSFCDVRDTVAALDIIANNTDLKGEIINVGQDKPITIVGLANLIRQLSQSESQIKFLTYTEAYGQDYGQGYEDILHRKPDLTKFYKYTSYQFQWSLEKTLSDLIERQRKCKS